MAVKSVIPKTYVKPSTLQSQVSINSGSTQKPQLQAELNVDSEQFPSGVAHRANIKDFIAKEKTDIQQAGLTQRPGTESFAKFHDGPAPKGVAVLFHGASVSPAQWEYMVNDVFNKGYDVFVPKLPGHGLLNSEGKPDTSLVPDAMHFERWDSFAEDVFKTVAPAGKVTPIGLSLGGMVALKMATAHAQDTNAEGQKVIEQVIAISPFLGFAGVKDQLMAKAADVLMGVVPEQMNAALKDQEIYVEGKNSQKVADGFPNINKSIALGMYRGAQPLLAKANQLKGTSSYFVFTEADNQVNVAAAERFADTAGGASYVFPASDKVPHAMNNPYENPDARSVGIVRDAILSRL